MSIVDTHSHLDTAAFEVDRDAVLERALRAGVHAIVLIGYDPERWRAGAALCARRQWLVRAAGIHPNSAEIWDQEIAATLDAELARGDSVAVGEIGLDFFREHTSPERQRAAFAAQLRLAREHELPIIIHQRSAEVEVLEALRPLAPVSGVMHCFSGDSDFAHRCLELGLHLGVGGVITYPKSAAVRAALASIPLERVVVETDAPYLAPHGLRNKRNEPAWITSAVEMLASLREVAPERIAEVTTANATALFGERLARARAAGERAACA